MRLAPVREERRSSYPRWGTAIARSLRRAAISSVGAALIGALGCAPPPPGVVAVQPEPTSPHVEPELREEWVRLPLRIRFQWSRAELDDSARAMLRELLAMLEHRQDVLRIRVEGHAISDWGERTEGLALARADAVLRYLVDEGGLPEELLEVVEGDGGYSTAGIVNHVEWQRVEFLILIRRQVSP